MHVVATAGHVDHGKSTLIHALTGQQPDRLDEERRRGLSIELGYCWTRLPRSGDVAFVDVPGHEKFVSTMMAGVGPVPVVLLVVAADDPWMPQAAEHLAVVDALQIRHGVLVVTRSDLADPEPARRRARAALARTSVADVPDVTVSAATGQGLAELAAVLDGVLATMTPPPSTDDVRLWIDRVFTLPGAGTVVTGTLPEGRIAVGDVLRCGDAAVRVRGLHTLGRSVPDVHGVARVSVRLGSGAPPNLRRGLALVSDRTWTESAVIDVRVDGTAVPREPMLHVGSASVPTRSRVLSESAEATAVRLTLPRPLPWHVGDRVVLRDPGRRRTWGADVLDPLPRRLRRRGDGRRLGNALLSQPVTPTLAFEVRRRGIVARTDVRRLGIPEPASGDTGNGTVHVVADWYVDSQTRSTLQARLRRLVEERQRTAPLDRGVPVGESLRTLGLPDEHLLGLLLEPPLTQHNGRITASPAEDLPHWLADALSALEHRLADRPFQPPDANELADLSLDRRAVAAAARAGRLLRLSDTVVLGVGADRLAVDLLRDLPQPFTASQARQRLDSSRRVVLPLLDHLDRAGLTERHSDDRRSIRASAP